MGIKRPINLNNKEHIDHLAKALKELAFAAKSNPHHTFNNEYYLSVLELQKIYDTDMGLDVTKMETDEGLKLVVKAFDNVLEYQSCYREQTLFAMSTLRDFYASHVREYQEYNKKRMN